MSSVTCRICLRSLVRPKRRGRPSDAHEECRRVVELYIIANRRKRAPRHTVAEKPAGRPLAAPPCDFCGRIHAGVADALECRQRAERAARDVAVLR